MDAIDQDLLRGLDLIRSIERCVPSKVVDHAHLKRIYDQQNDARALRDAGLITEGELCRRRVVLRRDLSPEEDDIIAGMFLQKMVEKILSEPALHNVAREEVARYVIKRFTEQGLDDNMERFLPYLMGELRYW
jgi:hypothetical protein